MRELMNRCRLRLALWLLNGLPANMWVGKHVGTHGSSPAWGAGRLTARGVLKSYPLAQVFDAVPVVRAVDSVKECD